jgi:hypothetical protein
MRCTNPDGGTVADNKMDQSHRSGRVPAAPEKPGKLENALEEDRNWGRDREEKSLFKVGCR